MCLLPQLKKEELSKNTQVDGGWLLDRVSGKVHLGRGGAWEEVKEGQAV